MNSKTCQEKVDLQILNKLLLSSYIDTVDKNSLRDYKKLVKNGYATILYKKSAMNIGRWNANKKLSLQSFKKQIRHTLSSHLYHDVDIVNAHPTFLEQYCRKEGWNCTNLKKYNKNREFFLKSVMDTCNVDRETAKNLLLRMIFLGSYENWMAENNVTIKPPDIFLCLDKELKKISENVWNKETDIVNKVKKQKKTNAKASVLSITLQCIENDILERMNDFFVQKNYKVGVLVFDGLMIEKETGTIDQSILDECSSYIKQILDWDIKLIEKPMNLGFDLDIPECDNFDWEPDPSKLIYYDQCYCANLDGSAREQYLKKKIYIEYFLCKVRSPEVAFLFKEGNEKVDFHSQSGISQLLEPIEITTEDGIMPFFIKWKKDPYHFNKRKCDFIPCNFETDNTPEDIYNLFTGFNPSCKADFNKQNQAKILTPYFDLIKAVCGETEKYKTITNVDQFGIAKGTATHYVLSFFANIFQTPLKRPPVMIIFYGKQGIGKNVAMSAVQNLIGEHWWIDSSDPKDFFGDHAEGFFRKLFIILNELDGKDTFDFEGKMKTFVTEPTISVNPKNVRPFQVQNHARCVVLTNKSKPLKMDVTSGGRKAERRIVAIEGDETYLTKSSKFWKALTTHFKKDTFIAALYDFFINYDINSIDWDSDRPITNIYKQMVKAYAPHEANFFADYLSTLQIDDCKECKIKQSELYGKFKSYCIENNFYTNAAVPNIKFFTNKITTEMRLPIKEDNEHKVMLFKFIPFEVYKYIVMKKWIIPDKECDFVEDEIQLEDPEPDYFID